jgi:putative glycosyltransferase
MKLSIVTTLYHSSPYLHEFHRRITATVDRLGITAWELVMVNDGSPDDSLARALALTETDPRVVVVDLSRNFGHHKAMMTGMAHTSGEYVLIIDSDLEEAPELLETYWRRMLDPGDVDVVYGSLVRRKGGTVERSTGGLFYRLLNLLSGEKMPVDIGFSRLMTRRYVDSLLRFREREMYIGGLWHITGYDQVAVPIEKTSKGISSYTLGRKVEMLINAITAFSSLPLRLIFHTGLLTTFAAMVLGAFYTIRKFVYRDVLGGWTSLIVIILFMSGLIMLSIGVIAIYLSKVFVEVKQRPYTIVRAIHQRKAGASP